MTSRTNDARQQDLQVSKIDPRAKQLTAEHQPFEAVHVSEREWEILRWPGQHNKMLFHPNRERPTEPNAGLVRYEPGAHHPLHNHDFAQIWYILEGEFEIGSKTYTEGTMIFHPDPHFESDLSTSTGGVMLFVQYQGPSTGGRPVYDGRFNLKVRKAVSDERIDK